MKFSSREIKELIIAGIFISLAFAILLSGGARILTAFDSKMLIVFLIAFFTAGIGFLFHEIMHKYVAQNYKLNAEFRAYYPGLWLTLMISFFGFIIAAPGAVHISGFITRERNGKISLAGPMTNIILAILFLIPALFINKGLLGVFFSYGFSINSLLALFNMIPAMPFDGYKVLAWNKTVYGITIAVSATLFIISLLI